MQIISVPYFVGEPMARFTVPQPAVVVDPPMSDHGQVYDTSRAQGPGDVAQHRMAVLYRELAGLVGVLDAPLVYAGDCLAVIGVLAGLQRRDIDPTLYWFDAHGDFHTWATTGSSFLGGMPLAMLTGRGEQTIVAATGLTPIADEKVLLINARDLDAGEGDAVAASGITMLSVHDVATSSPPPGPIYVHLDVDVVDPSDLPAVNYPARHGPSADEVRDAIHHLARTGRVVAASVSSWNPALPGAERAAEVTRSIMGIFED
ncbi:MAG: arginase family protein [Actinomycetia bacterium]|nr:arginase family protein [Actinomycetes bacterium]